MFYIFERKIVFKYYIECYVVFLKRVLLFDILKKKFFVRRMLYGIVMYFKVFVCFGVGWVFCYLIYFFICYKCFYFLNLFSCIRSKKKKIIRIIVIIGKIGVIWVVKSC